MLVQFALENYGLFGEEALLDCIPAPINEHKETLLPDTEGKGEFLPVAALYGPNGCGKSSLLLALSDLCRFVTGDSALAHSYLTKRCLFFGERDNRPMTFDVLFRNEGYLFRYQLFLEKAGCSEEHLFYGKLNSQDTGVVFSRTRGGIHLGKALSGLSLEPVDPYASLLPVLAEVSDLEYVKAAVSWFSQTRLLSGGTLPPSAPVLPETEEEKQALCLLLNEMGMAIGDYEEKVSQEEIGTSLYLRHDAPGFPSFFLPYEAESSGTKKLLHLLSAVLNSLKQGSLLMVDDLDAFLHPYLLRFVVELFKSREKNPHGSQLLFTSHNTAILTPALMRRDEICLCWRSETGAALLCPLSSYKKENGLIPRNDEAYGKQYLEGRYGAVPFDEGWNGKKTM